MPHAFLRVPVVEVNASRSTLQRLLPRVTPTINYEEDDQHNATTATETRFSKELSRPKL
jgi:hypothetical protein